MSQQEIRPSVSRRAPNADERETNDLRVSGERTFVRWQISILHHDNSKDIP
jgi:hypothetical protein